MSTLQRRGIVVRTSMWSSVHDLLATIIKEETFLLDFLVILKRIINIIKQNDPIVNVKT